MLSRVAESVYWMSRYIERAENVARFVDVNQHLTLDLPGEPSDQWTPLVATTGDDGWFAERYGTPRRETVLRFLLFDQDYPNSVASCFRSARENARGARDIVASDLFEQLNRAYLMVKDASRTPEGVLQDPGEFLQAVKEACHALLGSTMVTMSRNEAWHFMRVGRLLERADKTSRIVDVKYFLLLPSVADVGGPADELQWAALLHSASGFEMYRKRFGRIDPTQVVEFLLLEDAFPRSCRYCASLAERSLRVIDGERRSAVARSIGRIASDLEFVQVEEIIDAGLHQWVDRLQTSLNQVGLRIAERFFGAPIAGESPAEPTAPAGHQFQRQH